MRKNNHAIGFLRLCLIMAVVLHHSVLAYCVFGHFDHHAYLLSSAPIIDQQRWAGFDLLVRWNDTYFMALMFFISGVFVLPSLHCKGPRRYLKDRLLRLGLPFAVCVSIVMPVAYYPSILEAGARVSFFSFWQGYFGRFHWPGGPAWFIWFLFVLDALCVLIVRLAPSLPSYLAARVPDGLNRRPVLAVCGILGAALVAYVPFVLLFGAERWLSWGPFSIQGSRIGLYGFFFGLGCAAGAAGSQHILFQRNGALARHWAGALCLGVGAFGWFIALPAPFEKIRPVLFVFCSVLFCLALMGVCLRFVSTVSARVNTLTGDAYGVYLIHYAFVTWAQFALLPASWGAIPKAACVTGITLCSSFLVTHIIRFFPGIQRLV